MVDVEASDNSDPDQLVTVHGRLGNVTFKPYRDIKTRSVNLSAGTENGDSSTAITVDNLYPEILCHIFSHLDTSSKGRAAQVTISTYPANLLTPALGLHSLEEHPQH